MEVIVTDWNSEQNLGEALEPNPGSGTSARFVPPYPGASPH
jgi:hypothetical protein